MARIFSPELPQFAQVVRAAPAQVEMLPPPTPLSPPRLTLEPMESPPHSRSPSTVGPVNNLAPQPTPTPNVATPVRVLPLSLETLFRLAEEKNPQVRLAREQVTGACADLDVARNNWLPKIYAGPAYYRHEGGIQDQNGQLIHSSTGALFAGLEVNALCDIRDATFQRVRAERELWQQKGELSRITNVTLLAASSAYMDLLTARTGEEVVRSVDTQLQALLKLAEDLGQNVPQAPVESIRAEVHANQQVLLKLRQLGDAASARLAYLLGVCPGTLFEPVDATLAPFGLVDATPGAGRVGGAGRSQWAGGARPGRDAGSAARQRRQGGRPNAVPAHRRDAHGRGPVWSRAGIEPGLGQPLGPGPASALERGEFLDVQAAATSRGIAVEPGSPGPGRPAHKLSAGVQEARETIHNTGYQIRQGQQQIDHSEKSVELLTEILKSVPQKDRALVDVMRGLMQLKQAQQDYLTAVNTYDKAQLRLLLLLGPLGPHH